MPYLIRQFLMWVQKQRFFPILTRGFKGATLYIEQTQVITAMLNDVYAASDETQKKLMLEIIEQGSYLEWQFWDDAYCQRKFCW